MCARVWLCKALLLQRRITNVISNGPRPKRLQERSAAILGEISRWEGRLIAYLTSKKQEDGENHKQEWGRKRIEKTPHRVGLTPGYYAQYSTLFKVKM